ncbi:hypothetical protein G8G26_003245 [Escherichia coli]|nr:hypothetical protein [Escherichia coli]
MNPSQHAEQFQSQLANYVPQFTPEFWPVWLIIAGVLLVGMWLVLGLHALLRARGVKKSVTDYGEKIYLYCKKVTSRRNNSATCPDFFSNQMKEKDFFLFVVFVFSGRFWLFSSFVYCTVYCKNGL